MEVALPPAIEPTGPRIELDLSSEEGSDDSASIDCSSTDSDDEDEDDDGTLQPEPEPEPEPQPQARGGAAGRRGLQRSARKAMLESLPSSRQLLESQLTPPSIGAEPAPQPESPMAPVAPVTPPALAQVAEAPPRFCVAVTNTGDREGSAVVLAFITSAHPDWPSKRLFGFARHSSKRGASVTVSIQAAAEFASTVSEDGVRKLLPSSFEVSLGDIDAPARHRFELTGPALTLEAYPS